jgi:N-acetylmuramoyl-L-alanine amidase
MTFPANTWVTLDSWCRLNHFATPSRATNEASAIYSVATPNGTLTLRAGSRAVVWGGEQLLLGFTPHEVEGRLLIHALDTRKNLQPLLEDFALPAPGNRIIVIDPGHGGGNTGTKSVVDGRFEKEFTLDWAHRLATILATNGWKVFLTRTNDVEVPLGDRVDFAERQRADFFLSLHFNASPTSSPEPNGLEVYCLTPTGMPSNLTRDFDDDATQVYPNNAFDKQNLQFAAQLQHTLLAVNGHVDRGLAHARFLGVLRRQSRPAVLVEGGFLSNPDEARRIADPAFRQKLAEAVAEALR